MGDDISTGTTLITGKAQAEAARKVIMELGLFDPDRSIRSGDRVFFPIRSCTIPEMEGFTIMLKETGVTYTLLPDSGLTRERKTRTGPPLLEVIRKLSVRLPPGQLDLLPRKYEKVGDVLVLVFDPSLDEVSREVADAFRDVLGVRYVLRDLGGVSGELREPKMEVLIPPPDGIFTTVHREHGVLYFLDPRQIMMSSGNVEERSKAGKLLTEGPPTPRSTFCRSSRLPFDGEVVCDLFAGIGYFTLPMAVKARPKRVISVEKNVRAYRMLCMGISLNGSEDRVAPVLGDNRSSVPEGIADRVVMGYVGGTVKYLESALRCVSPFGAVVHLHDTAGTEVGASGLFQIASGTASSCGFRAELIGWRRVKSFAPCIDHYVLDMLLVPE